MAKLHTLILTDGTTRIDLLSKNQQYGWFLRNATLNFPTFKGDGSWSDPVTADERQLSFYTLTNANDGYELTLKSSDADTFNRLLADMRTMLFRAANYWVNGLNGVVWLEARGINESVTRYAVVKAGQLDGEATHWGATFFQPDCEPVMEFTLAIERSMWTKYPPNTSEQICLASTIGIETVVATANTVRLGATPSDAYFRGSSMDSTAFFQNLWFNDFVFTLGVRLPTLATVGWDYLMTTGVAGGAPVQPFDLTISASKITFEYDRATTNYYIEWNIPPEVVQERVFLDFVWDASAVSFTLYINGDVQTPGYEQAGSGALDVHNDIEWRFMSDGVTASRVNFSSIEYLRFDSDTSYIVGSRDREITTCEVALLCNEGFGLTLNNSGTLGASGTVTAFNSTVWSGVQETGIVQEGKETCSLTETTVAGVSLPVPITHMFSFDASGPTWSSNLIDSTPPYEILDFAPVTGDYLYVGSTDGRFTHIVFNLNPAAVGIDDEGGNIETFTLWNRWEISRGGSVWASFSPLGGYDTTRSLAVPGVGNVSGFTGDEFTSTDWAQDTVNGVLAYWLRLPFITGMWTGTWVNPVQDEYQVHSGIGHVNISSYDGNSSGFSQLDLKGASLALRQRDNFPTQSRINRIAGGFRSNDRGTDFINDIFVDDDLLPDGIAFDTTYTGYNAPTNDADAPGGTSVQGEVPADPTNNPNFVLAQWTFQDNIATQYAGVYKLYARVSTVRDFTAGNWLNTTTGRLTASVLMGTNLNSMNNAQLLSTVVGRDVLAGSSGTGLVVATNYTLFEIGTIRLPEVSSYNTKSDFTLSIGFRQNGDGVQGDSLFLSDIVLIPTDEWAFFAEGDEVIPDYLSPDKSLTLGTIIDTDGVTDIDMHTRKNLLLDSVSNLRQGTVSYEYIDKNYPIKSANLSSMVTILDGITGSWKFDSSTPLLIPNVKNGGRLYICYPDHLYATALQMTARVNPVYFSLGDTDA